MKLCQIIGHNCSLLCTGGPEALGSVKKEKKTMQVHMYLYNVYRPIYRPYLYNWSMHEDARPVNFTGQTTILIIIKAGCSKVVWVG